MTDQTSGDPHWRPSADPQVRPPPGSAPKAPPGYKLTKKKPFYKRVRFWPLAIIAVIVVVIAACTGTANNAVNRAHTVVYTVTSDASTAMSITYLSIHGDGTSGQEQATNVVLPWSKTVSGKGDFSSFTLAAQASQTATKISCQIKIDGAVKANQTSSGQFTIVTCSATPSSAGAAENTPAPTTTPAPPTAATTSPQEQSLAERQQRLSAETNGESAEIVQVPAGFQAATYNQSGQIRFWFETTAGTSWRQIGESRYPALPQLGPPGAVVMGALLRHMSDATFIVRGVFTGDGTGNAVAFTGGPRGWGAIKAEPNGNIGPSGEPVGDDKLGLSYEFAFRNGLLETQDCPIGRPTYQCSTYAIVKLWEWQTSDFTRVS